MALFIEPDRFIILKQKIKQECQRRNHNITGKSVSVAPYGEIAYDYTNIPQTNGIITEEHWDKLIIPMNQINSNNNYKTAQEDNIPVEDKIFDIETKIDTYSKISVTNHTTTSCNGNCTGLCYTTCTTGCYGCTSCTSCSGCSGCSGCTSCTSCSGGCDGCSGCSGGCTSCSGCSGCGSCGSTPCATSCSGGCKGCSNSCSGSKTGTCVGCSGTSTHSS